MISAIEPTEKKNNQPKAAAKGNAMTNAFQSFKTINVSNKNNNNREIMPG